MVIEPVKFSVSMALCSSVAIVLHSTRDWTVLEKAELDCISVGLSYVY